MLTSTMATTHIGGADRKVSVMGSEQKRIIVLCRHAGVLLNYSALFNQLGCFNVSLCSNMNEVLKALRHINSADYFLLDDFKVGSVDEHHIKNLNFGGRIKQFLLVGDFIFDDHCRVFTWARAHHISLLGMIRPPLRTYELGLYLEVG